MPSLSKCLLCACGESQVLFSVLSLSSVPLTHLLPWALFVFQGRFLFTVSSFFLSTFNPSTQEASQIFTGRHNFICLQSPISLWLGNMFHMILIFLNSFSYGLIQSVLKNILFLCVWKICTSYFLGEAFKKYQLIFTFSVPFCSHYLV